LELALVLTSGNIYLAGMDFSVNDIKSHARPNGFDYLFYGTASRLRPVYSQLFSRSRDIKSGGSLDIYAGWFKNRLEFLKKTFKKDRIFTLTGTTSFGTSSDDINFFQAVSMEGDPASRVKKACDVLVAALKNPDFSETLIEELAVMLFPSKQKTCKNEIAGAINDITLRYRGGM